MEEGLFSNSGDVFGNGFKSLYFTNSKIQFFFHIYTSMKSRCILQSKVSFNAINQETIVRQVHGKNIPLTLSVKIKKIPATTHFKFDRMCISQ